MLREYIRQILLEDIKFGQLKNPFQFHGNEWKRGLSKIPGPDLSKYDGKPVSSEEAQYVEDWIEERNLDELGNDWVAFSRGSASLMMTMTDCNTRKGCRVFDKNDRFIFIAPAAMRPNWQAINLIGRLPGNEVVIYAHEADGAVSIKQVAQFAQKVGADKIHVFANQKGGRSDVTKIGGTYTNSKGQTKEILAGKTGTFAHIAAWEFYVADKSYDYIIKVSDAINSNLPDWGGTPASGRTKEELMNQINISRQLGNYPALK